MISARKLPLLTALFLASNCGLAQEQGPADLILILDASNSMWGQIEGENKIVIARRAVGGLIDELPDETHVGLLAYGHRREGDCTDIEVLQEPAPVAKAALKSTINGINPKGKTPITGAVNAAIDLARDRNSASILLISDGLETCDMDPCAAVRTAKSAGVPFVLHVVGFDVGGENTAQLECLAQAGEGEFLSAENAEELSAALQSAYEKPTVPDGRLVITATAEGGLQDAVIRVFDAMNDEEVAGGRTYAAAETNPRSIPLADGDYRATVNPVGIRGAAEHEFSFQIDDGSRVERAFDFGVGELAVRVLRNGALSDATVRVLNRASSTQVAAGRTYRGATSNPKVFPLTGGTYDVVIKSVELRHATEHRFQAVTVTGGERVDLTHEYTSGTLRVGVGRGETLVDAVVNIYDAAGASIRGGRTYTNSDSTPLSVVLAPGEYTLRIREIRGERREVIATVVAGEITETFIDLDET